MSAVIELNNIVKIYKTGQTELKALKGVNLTVNKGELVAIMGESGSGKSTILNILGVLDRPTTGTYHLSGTHIEDMKDDDLSTVRNQKIGFVFQSFFLLPKLNSIQNIILPLMYRGVAKAEAKEYALAMLEKVSIPQLAYNKPHQMSGGQQQRVAIARALVGNPDLILADEPTGALDSKTSSEVMALFKSLHKDEGKTIVIVTHDPKVGAQCDRMVRLQDGEIIEDVRN